MRGRADRAAGGEPSFTQKLLIRRLSRAMLRLELLDEKATVGTLTDHDGRTFSALSNQVRLLAREIGLQARPCLRRRRLI